MTTGTVAPFTGAWIEILMISPFGEMSFVAPFTGAWIEILDRLTAPAQDHRRSLHGSVD